MNQTEPLSGVKQTSRVFSRFRVNLRAMKKEPNLAHLPVRLAQVMPTIYVTMYLNQRVVSYQNHIFRVCYPS